MEQAEKDKLEWMYKGASNVVDREEYLLGRAVDKAFERSEYGPSDKNEIEKDCLPQSIFSNAASSIQVDVFRKKQEDPLELIRQKEIEYRKQLLKNPIKLKKLQNMLQEQSKIKAKIIKKKEKKKKKYSSKASSSDNDEDLDAILTSKYIKLAKKYGLEKLKNLKNDSSSESKSESSSESEGDQKKRKKKKGQRETSVEKSSIKLRKGKYENKNRNERRYNDKYRARRERSRSSSSSNSSTNQKRRKREQNKAEGRKHEETSTKRKKELEIRNSRNRPSSSSESDDNDSKGKVTKTYEKSKHSDKNFHNDEESELQEKPYGLSVPKNAPEPRRYPVSKPTTQKQEANPWKKHQRTKLTEEEKEKKRREMMENAKWRNEIREKNIKRYKDEEEKEKDNEKEYDSEFLRKQMVTMISKHNSVEDRIKSNINSIQRTKMALDKSFIKR